MYADQKRENARESDIVPGGAVLLKREQPGKLDTPFIQEPFQVASKAGIKVTLESPDGASFIFSQHVTPQEVPWTQGSWRSRTNRIGSVKPNLGSHIGQ